MSAEPQEVMPDVPHECLCDVRNGSSVRIKNLKGEPAICERLREMGFCETACIRKVADNGALICSVRDSRVMISEHLAKNIYVEPLTTDTR